MATIDLNKIQPGTQIRSNGIDGVLIARLGALPSDPNITVDFVDTANRLVSGHQNINVSHSRQAKVRLRLAFRLPENRSQPHLLISNTTW